jgi:hypothetical protein
MKKRETSKVLAQRPFAPFVSYRQLVFMLSGICFWIAMLAWLLLTVPQDPQALQVQSSSVLHSIHDQRPQPKHFSTIT